jgi:hypothetical protein
MDSKGASVQLGDIDQDCRPARSTAPWGAYLMIASPASNPEALAPVKYLTVEWTADYVAEWGDGRAVVVVPRERIVGVELRRGICGERPVLQVLVGACFVAAGLVFFGAVPGVLGSRIGARFGAAGSMFLVLGAYLLWTGVRRGVYFLVRTERDARKLLLRGRLDHAELRAALYEARRRFGYQVTWHLEGELRDPR